MVSPAPRPPAPEARARRPSRWLVMVGVLLTVAGLAGVAVGSFRLATAAGLRGRAEAIEAEATGVRADQASVQDRSRKREREADRLRTAENTVVDGVIDILRFSDVVLGRYNAMIGAFNRAVDSYNAGDTSGSTAIIEEQAGPAIEDVAGAVQQQQRTLAAVRRGFRMLEEALRR